MKFATSLTTALLAFTASISSVVAIRSKPFYLVVISDDEKLNGTALNACHEGAALEGLCKGITVNKSNPKYTTYNYNFTKSEPNSGIITYELVSGSFRESEPMNFYYAPSTNVALPLFESGTDAIYVSFDKDEYMYIKRSLDDTVTPPTYKGGKLYSWYMCETYFTGYTYHTLSWVAGIYPPQNPTCKKIQVLRQFK